MRGASYLMRCAIVDEDVGARHRSQIGRPYQTTRMAIPTILIVGTLDTKLDETLFLRDQILSSGTCSVKVRRTYFSVRGCQELFKHAAPLPIEMSFNGGVDRMVSV